jgi:hypothetical protein
MTQPLTRRMVLRAAGVSLALPMLDAMIPGTLIPQASAAPSQFKAYKESPAAHPRLVFCYFSNGVNIKQWKPATTGLDYALSPTLKGLETHKKDFTVISGLGHPASDGGHSGADTWLTGADLDAKPGSDYTNTVSIDQQVAAIHEKHTRIASLQLSDQSGSGAALHSHTLSFDHSGTPLPSENSPRRLFERLFVPEQASDRAATLQRYQQQRSILDSVQDESKKLAKRLGKDDRQKLAEYFESVRATETRIERLEGWIDVPKPKVDPSLLQLNSQPGNAHDRPMWLDVMLELSYLAMLTDSTRVIGFQWAREAAGYGGGGENHHELSHHGGDPGMLEKLAVVDRFYLSRLARFLDLLAETKEGDGRMLDSTVVMYGSGMNSGEGGEHSPKDLPLLIAGGTGLGVKHAGHLAFDVDKHPPMSNLLLSLGQKVGLETDKFSDATGTLANL